MKPLEHNHARPIDTEDYVPLCAGPTTKGDFCRLDNGHEGECDTVQAGGLRYAKVSPEFGTAWANGCCNALVDCGTSLGEVVCGWPRYDDGSCPEGHPSELAIAPAVPTHTGSEEPRGASDE